MKEKTATRKKKSVAKSENSETAIKKGLGLFDHIKHIQRVQDPEYFNRLSELDRKTFNHFMILRGLSMNPKILEDIAFLYRYFDTIPSSQFYTLIISTIRPDPNFYKWIKAKKKKYSKELIALVMRKFECSESEATDYITIFQSTDSGLLELISICQGFGLTEKEVEEIISTAAE